MLRPGRHLCLVSTRTSVLEWFRWPPEPTKRKAVCIPCPPRHSDGRRTRHSPRRLSRKRRGGLQRVALVLAVRLCGEERLEHPAAHVAVGDFEAHATARQLPSPRTSMSWAPPRRAPRAGGPAARPDGDRLERLGAAAAARRNGAPPQHVGAQVRRHDEVAARARSAAVGARAFAARSCFPLQVDHLGRVGHVPIPTPPCCH